MEQDIRLIAEDVAKIDNRLLLVSIDVNAIYQYDLDLNEAEYWGAIPEEPIFKERLCSKIDVYKNKIIFTPMSAEKIWIYHTDTTKWTGIELKKLAHSNHAAKFFQTHLYKNKLYLVGSQYPAIICLNLDTETIEYIEEVYKSLYDKYDEKKDCYFRRNGALVNGRLYLASCISNEIIILDVESCAIEIKTIGSDEYRYSGILWDNDRFIISPRRNTPIIFWKKNGEIKEIALPEKLNEDKYTFLGVNSIGDKYLFPAMNLDHSLLVDKNDLEKMDIIQSVYKFVKNDNGYYISLDKEGTYLYGTDNRFDIDVYYGDIRQERKKQFDEEYGEICKKRFDNLPVAREMNRNDLEKYIFYVMGM